MATTTDRDLLNRTSEFFKLYWNVSEVPPSWNEPWDWNTEIPGQRNRGCYALFQGDEVVYIGVGLGKSTEKYDGAGLGDRLKRYWQLNKGEDRRVKRYQPTHNWKEITALKTIDFDEEHYHLAAALEIFLIRKLKPKRNKVHGGVRS